MRGRLASCVVVGVAILSSGAAASRTVEVDSEERVHITLEFGDGECTVFETEQGLRKVERTMRRSVHRLRHLRVEGPRGVETILTTDEHPFYQPARAAWVKAGRLTEGDGLASGGGASLAVASTASLPSRTRVYNLTVAPPHNYFVGSAAVVVHNKNVLFDADEDGALLELSTGEGWIAGVYNAQKRKYFITGYERLPGDAHRGAGTHLLEEAVAVLESNGLRVDRIRGKLDVVNLRKWRETGDLRQVPLWKSARRLGFKTVAEFTPDAAKVHLTMSR